MIGNGTSLPRLFFQIGDFCRGQRRTHKVRKEPQKVFVLLFFGLLTKEPEQFCSPEMLAEI